MDTILSNDGTPIAFQRSGTGPPLVLVHGMLGSHSSWASVVPALETQFTVYALDRRGRGASGDGPTYTIEREAEDIAAVVNAIGEDVSLLGHSFGGLCVLEAAFLTPRIRRLIVYEPSPLAGPGESLLPAGVLDRLQALLEAGDRESVVTTFMQDIVGLPPHEIELVKASPAFPARIAAAHTIPRESRVEEEYRLEPARFSHLTVPVMLLLGGDSPDAFKTTIDAWYAALPNSRIVVLPEQQHLAHYTAPDLFVRAVQAFVSESGP